MLASGSAALGVSAPLSPTVAIYSTERTPCIPHARYTCSRAGSERAVLTTLTYTAHRILLEDTAMMASEALLKQCYNKGCGKKYSEEEDTEGDPYNNHQII